MADVIYAGEPGEDHITIWDVSSRKPVMTLQPKDARALSFAFSAHGKRLQTGFGRGTSIIWDLEPSDQCA